MWPIKFDLNLVNEADGKGRIELRSGVTTLVGPNGSGKSRALRGIKSGLDNEQIVSRHSRKTHLLAAGRSSPLEVFRAAVNSPGGIQDTDAAVGHRGYRERWWDFESITGSLLVLDSRPSLRLKIEARLQQLFDRSVQLSWSQDGLNVHIAPTTGGKYYPANYEASGILQLVALLAAIHNDEIGALLIDEPEISLHPQHQAFLLEEMESVAGHPSDPSRKLIVIATHSTAMLPLRKISQLPSIAFFNSPRRPPAQISDDAEILKRKKLSALIARLSATHRIAMFAEHVLLLEGPSDEIIATQLARKLDMRLLARNAQIVPITGKGEFIEAAKLFRMLNKRVAILADLDALADDGGLVSYFGELAEAKAIADQRGWASLVNVDRDLRGNLHEFIGKHGAAVEAAAQSYRPWSTADDAVVQERRVTLARLLTAPETFGDGASTEALSLRTRYTALLDALGALGCFFLRRGAIENYYQSDPAGLGKAELAAIEAESFESASPADLFERFGDLVAALAYVAPKQLVDEDYLLRPKLGAILAATLLGMSPDSSDEKLNAIARTTIGSDAEVFNLANKSDRFRLRVEVSVTTSLFERATFPFEIGADENITNVVRTKLPGNDAE